MAELWFVVVTGMFTVYAVLDGYDFGAGALHLFVARTDGERRTVLAAIGPYWDANEVWLISAGGALFAAFPRVLSAGFSGFYLAIFLVAWALLLRAISIEFRSHVRDGLWRGFWDATFCGASALLPVLFGAALANVIRGVPLTREGWFQLTLFTHFLPRTPVGILDGYTVLAGVFTLVALAGHGALFLAWRTGGPVGARSRTLGLRLHAATAVLWVPMTLATRAVNPGLLAALPGRPAAWLGVLLAVTGVVTVFRAGARGRMLWAFLGSCAFLAGLLAATAACLFPVLLRSIDDPALSLTAFAGGTSDAGLRTALGWWLAGIPLVVFYFVLSFRIHRGTVVAPGDGEGY